MFYKPWRELSDFAELYAELLEVGKVAEVVGAELGLEEEHVRALHVQGLDPLDPGDVGGVPPKVQDPERAVDPVVQILVPDAIAQNSRDNAQERQPQCQCLRETRELLHFKP